MKQDYEHCHFTALDWVVHVGLALMLGCGVNLLCYRSWWAFPFLLPAGIWYIRWCRKARIEKRKKLLYYHFYDVLRGFETAVRAGYSMENAVTECRKELFQIYGAEEDLVQELTYMEAQMRVGIPLEQLCMDLGQRSGVEDIRNFGEIFLIAKRSGGNMGEITEQLARVLGEKIRVEKEIDVCISGKKTEQLVMSLVPGGMILYMQWTSDGFLDVLYHNPAGASVMTICLIIYMLSFWMGRKIVRIPI